MVGAQGGKGQWAGGGGQGRARGGGQGRARGGGRAGQGRGFNCRRSWSSMLSQMMSGAGIDKPVVVLMRDPYLDKAASERWIGKNSQPAPAHLALHHTAPPCHAAGGASMSTCKPTSSLPGTRRVTTHYMHHVFPYRLDTGTDDVHLLRHPASGLCRAHKRAAGMVRPNQARR